jgi:hypothetical protein
LVEHEAATIAIVEIGCMHHGHEQVPWVSTRMWRLRESDFLAAVKPARPARMGLDRRTYH